MWTFDFGEFGLPVCKVDWEELTLAVFSEDSDKEDESTRWEYDREASRAAKRARAESQCTRV